MNQYQIGALAYLLEFRAEFLDWLIHSPSESTVFIIEDLTAMALKWLDDSLHAEIALLDHRSTHYTYLIDILIEIHIAANNVDFRQSITTITHSLFYPFAS